LLLLLEEFCCTFRLNCWARLLRQGEPGWPLLSALDAHASRNHGDIVRFAQEKMNLPKDKADEHRAQAPHLEDQAWT